MLMKRALLIASAVGAVGTLYWLTRPSLIQRLNASTCTIGDAEEHHDWRREVRALRDEVRGLRADLEREKARSRAARFAASDDRARIHDDTPSMDEHIDVPSEPRAIDTKASFEAEVARVDQRYARLDAAFHEQARNPRWAREHEQQILGLPAAHEYFRGTKFVEVECRSDWCRVVAEFANESDQGMFEETFPGFARGFGHSTMRTAPNAKPARTEVYLAREGGEELPR